MKKCWLSLGGAVGSLALFAACGDDVTQTVMEEPGVAELAHGESFPKCAKENSGEALFVADSGKFFYCLDGKWRELNGKDGESDTLVVRDTVLVIERDSLFLKDTLFVLDTLVGLDGKSCAAEMLSDSSGYKIVCGEDSIGVVLNGKDGLDGNDGIDGADGEKGESGKDGENGKDGVGCSLTDNGDGTVMLVCGEDTVALYKAFCDGKPFDPAKSFCLEGSVIALCGGSTFNPAESFCSNDSILALLSCNGKLFSPHDSICYDEKLFGFFEDDGRVYRTVKIGEQVWMAENLNNEKLGTCYENSADSCAKYGRLYNWGEALSICPQGYHLPTKGEWETLASFVENPLLLHAKNAWNDTVSVQDSFGFGVLPAGYYRPADGVFYSAGSETDFWTATENENVGGYAYRCGFSENQSSFYFGRNLNTGYRFSVRCVKD